MKKIHLHLLCGAAGLLLAGCSENTICIYGDSGSDSGNGDQPSTGSTLVTFDASVEARNMTRAMTPVRKNVRAQIFAYPASDAGASGTPVAEGAYSASTPGMLEGFGGYEMYLTSGNYDFYAVSENLPYAPPAFADAKSAPLENGIDYLWCSVPRQQITLGQANVPIVFLHSATQVVFNISAGQGITINSLVGGTVYAPAAGAQMDLSTGFIPPATTYETTVSKILVAGSLAQFTMLPIKSTAPLRVTFDVLVNGESSPRTYPVEVPLPDGEFLAGNSYRFLAELQANEVTFGSAAVVGWVDVDETGKPLYPDEK